MIPPKWLNRCDRCGWPLYKTIEEGCTEDNCSERPFKPIMNSEHPSTRIYIRALEAENESLKDKAAINTLAFNVSLKEVRRLKSNLESARLLCTETADEVCRLEDQLEDCTEVNLENMKKIARQETALDEIIKAPGGGPGKRIATQARRG